MFNQRIIRASLMLSLLVSTLCLVSTASAQDQRVFVDKNGDQRSSKPCDVLQWGGTVFDTRDCEELARTGRLFPKRTDRPKVITLAAGMTTEWQLVAKRVGERQTVQTSFGETLADIPVTVISKKDHSTVTKARTDSKGVFHLTIPRDFQGDVEFEKGVGPPFCFRKLESEHVTMEPICVDDAVFVFRVVQVRH